MEYIGTVSTEGKISVNAGTPSEANKLILSRLAEISTEFVTLRVSMQSMKIVKDKESAEKAPVRKLTVIKDTLPAYASQEDSPVPDLSSARREPETPADPDERGGKGLKQTYGSFGKFLHQFMFENGLTAKGISGLLNVTAPTIFNWVTGRTKPKEKAAKDIADKLQELSANEYRSAEIQALMR